MEYFLLHDCTINNGLRCALSIDLYQTYKEIITRIQSLLVIAVSIK